MNNSDKDSMPPRRISIIIWIWLALLLVVFAGSLLPSQPRLGRSAKVKVTKTQIGAFGQALDMFKSDNGNYPSGTKGLNDSVMKPAGASTNWHQYLDMIPVDPWGHPYHYEYPGKHGTNAYDISSAGPDGKFGTSDDISNW